MLKLYSFLASILSFFVLPIIFLIRIVQKKDVTSWKMKAGKFELPESYNKSKKTILIHGVSVGEIISLQKLIKRVKSEFADYNLVITTGTKAGYETAVKKMSDCADFITYFPFDTPVFVKKFLNKIQPDVVLMAETEIWPVFVYSCAKIKIPVFIINGRMSDESFRMYKFLKFFFKAVLPLYKGIFVQSETDKTRLEIAGAKNCEIMKNLKFDVQKTETNLNTNKTILIAGSTHHGEDEIILDVYKSLKSYFPELKLLLAPRHISRTSSIEVLIKKYDFKYNLYSKNFDFNDVDIVLLDVMGELAKLYSMCSVAFIGGSFNKTGGHNPLEAAIYDKPVVSGPSIKNFRDIYSILCTNNAGFVVKTKDELFKIIKKLLENKKFYNEISKNTKNVFENQKGALEFVIKKLKECANETH